MAEWVLRRRLSDPGIEVASAGVTALEGHPMDPIAASVLAEHGINGTDSHHARQVTSAVLHHSDLVLAMEQSQAAAIMRVAPEVSGKVYLLDKWQCNRDIPDPYRQQRIAYEHVFNLIDSSISAWLRYL